MGASCDVVARSASVYPSLHRTVPSGEKSFKMTLSARMARHTDANIRVIIHRFHKAARLGNTSRVRKILTSYGSIINRPSRVDHNTAIYLAAQKGHLEVVKFLVSMKAYVNVSNKEGATPLWIAVCNGHLAVVKFLKENGALVNTPTNSGLTAVTVALEKGYEEMFFYLMNNGVNLWYSLLHESCRILHRAVSRNNHTVVRYLIEERGVSVNTAINNDHLPIHYAAMIGNCEMVKYLIEQGASLNMPMREGGTALCQAAKRGHLEIVKCLVKHGARVNGVSLTTYNTPLHGAADFGDPAIVEYLLKKGAQVNRINIEGNTPLHIAAMRGHLRVAQVLLKYNARFLTNFCGASPHFLAQQYKKNSVAEFLFRVEFERV